MRNLGDNLYDHWCSVNFVVDDVIDYGDDFGPCPPIVELENSMSMHLAEGLCSEDYVAPYVRRPFERCRLFTRIEGESRTVQSVVYESDINRIVERYKREGVFPPQESAPQFEDVSGLNQDLTVLINKAASVNEAVAGNNAKAKAKRAKAEAEAVSAAAVTEQPEVDPEVKPVDK